MKRHPVPPSSRLALHILASFVTLVLTSCGSGNDGTGGAGSNADAMNSSASLSTAKMATSDAFELWAITVSSAEIDLAWTGSADDNATIIYSILRDGVEIASVANVTSFEDIGLRPATSYAYTIEARDGSGNLRGRSAVTSAITSAAESTAPEVVSTSTDDGEPVPVNSAIIVDFTAPMAVRTLDADAFKVETRNGMAVPGNISVMGNSATFTPSTDLAAGTEHVAKIAAGVPDAAGNTTVSEFATTFVSAAVADTAPPTVSSTYPLNSKTAVPINTSLSMTFSEPMLNATLTTSSVRLRKSGAASNISGLLKVIGNTAIFTPAARLEPNVLYQALITTDVKDAAGNRLAATYQWMFTTGSAMDTVAPSVVSTSPASNGTNVAINTSVRITFSEMMKRTTLTTSGLRMTSSSGALVSGKVYSASSVLQFLPTQNLLAGTRYTVVVTTASQDMAGNAAASYSWSFTTAATTDATRPVVSSVTPGNSSIGVPLNSSISATFSEEMRNSTITGSSIGLKNSSGVTVGGTVSMSGNTATFDPSTSLAGNTLYTATISTAVQDAAGNALATAFNWSFTTAAATTTTTLAWDAVTASTLGGYRVYYGTSPRNYLQAAGQGLNVGKTTTYVPSGLARGTRYYFATTAYDSSGRESTYSNEVFKDIP